ncbi:MAG: DHH family phosphoesterase [Candidatus ainarchaeum sp.]|jgi:RecJ-like exonuclease|nr:DHH family phosphoesterase [Candidatus ainarchaeum sp.]MDD4128871.1 DHH family phosphoesterase [Candidatus ainarchaeum sp.]MDD4468233.1 DHH family phosphoesterase [Candidatus ainarchaeum sp.]HPM85696.1 DHH family phosphoesterase [archaeon]
MQKKYVNNINEATAGTIFSGNVKILRKAKPGPVVFLVSDGTGTIDAVTKESSYETNDTIFLEGYVSERAGKKQIEIEKIKKSETDFTQIINEKSEPKEKPFSINSEKYEKMKNRIYLIAKRLRRAVIEGQPILIRHHADADGISAGIAIEKALNDFMIDFGTNPQYNLYRSPSKAPFYETTDMLKDLSHSKRLVNDFNQKKPLIVILDNGSTHEDFFALNMMHSLGFEMIVIDHHNPGEIINEKTSVCPLLSLHLNPYIFGYDSKICAAMLSYEVARLVNDKFENNLIPALAGISDRCEGIEIEQYIKNSGKTIEELQRIGVAIDFASYNLRFDAGEGIYEEFFTNQEIVSLIFEETTKGMAIQLQSTMPYVKTQELNGVILSHIDLEKYTVRFKYPPAGKVIGLIHDEISEGKENHAVITLGLLSDMIILRATKPILPIARIIERLKQKMPEANIEGGGHECAGTIKFVSAHSEKILEEIKEMIKQLKNEQKE